MRLTLEHRLRNMPIYQAEKVESLAYTESLYYRQRIAVVINFCRLMIVALYLFVFLPIFYGDIIFSSKITEIPSVLVSSVILSIVYFFWLSAMLLSARREHMHKRLLLVNAVVDTILLLLFSLILEITKTFNPVPMLFMVSIMASVLTLNARQSIIFGILCGMLIGIALGIYGSQVQFGDVISLHEALSGLILMRYVSNLELSELTRVILQSIIFGGAIMMLGYFSAKAQENKIHARLNRYFARNLSRINESVIEEMECALIVANTAGRIVTINRRAREMLNADDGIHQPLPLAAYSPELNRRFQKWLRMGIVEHGSLALSGGKYSLGFVALDKTPEPEMILIMLENEEVHYERVRETRLASLGRLSAGIAHEIRNPLSAIQQASELLNEIEGQDALVARLNEKISRNARRINAIVAEVMRLFDGQANQARYFPLNPALRHIAIEAREYAELKTVEIELSIEESKEIIILFSRDAIREIILNLMLNARKHNPDIALHISLSTRISDDKNNVYLDICDNGCGIEREDEDKIFEPFYSRRNSTGLGLYLVREMCNANHARIILLRRGQGACFRIIMRGYNEQSVAANLSEQDIDKIINPPTQRELFSHPTDETETED